MKKLSILLSILSLPFTLAATPIDWDPSGGYYPEDVKGIPLPNTNKSGLMVGVTKANGDAGVDISVEDTQGLRDLLSANNDLVALVEFDYWFESGEKSLVYMTSNSFKKPYLDVFNVWGYALGTSNKQWARGYLSLPLSGAEDAFNVGLNFRKAAPRYALYTPKIRFEKNLLQNPRADQVPVTENGWTQVLGDWSKTRVPKSSVNPNHGGPNSFWPGASAEGILEQEISLQNFANYLKTKDPVAVFSGYVTTYDADTDSAEMVLQSLDKAGQVIESVSTSPLNVDFWTPKTLTLKLSPKVEKLRVRLIANREKGQNNDAYFDNLTLVLPDSDPSQPNSFALATYDPEAKIVRLPGQEKLAEIPGLSRPFVAIPSNKSSLEFTIKRKDAYLLNEVPQNVYSYTPSLGERLTIKANRPGVAVQVINPAGYFIQDDGQMASTFVNVDLLPNQTYTILLSNYAKPNDDDYTITLTKKTFETAGSEEEVLTAFLGDKRGYLQKFDLTIKGETGVTMAFNATCPQIEGRALRLVRFDAKAGQKVSVKINPINVGLKIYDTKLNNIKPTSYKDGVLTFTSPKAQAYWIFAEAPRIKWYKEFTVEVTKSK